MAAKKHAKAKVRARQITPRAATPKAAIKRMSPEHLWADALVDEVNERLRRADVENDGVANLLVRELFANDVAAALDPDRFSNPRYELILARAGASLRLDAKEFSAHLTIGALNQERTDGHWRSLPWSTKLELLPLLKLHDDRKAFNAIVRRANETNAGMRHVRAWVQEATPRHEGSVGRPRNALTLPGTTRFAKTGVQLGDAAARARFVAKLAKVDPAQRKAFVKDLRETYKNLGALLGELGG
jgi:hypothetical protein